MEPVKVAFLSEGNGCRTQMAEAFARKFGQGVIEAYSAGTDPDVKIEPRVVAAMKQVGIDISGYRPKPLDAIPRPDFIVTMGNETKCPHMPGVPSTDWGLADPATRDDSFCIKIRDIIATRVKMLIEEIKESGI